MTMILRPFLSASASLLAGAAAASTQHHPEPHHGHKHGVAAAGDDRATEITRYCKVDSVDEVAAPSSVPCEQLRAADENEDEPRAEGEAGEQARRAVTEPRVSSGDRRSHRSEPDERARQHRERQRPRDVKSRFRHSARLDTFRHLRGGVRVEHYARRLV